MSANGRRLCGVFGVPTAVGATKITHSRCCAPVRLWREVATEPLGEEATEAQQREPPPVVRKSRAPKGFTPRVLMRSIPWKTPRGKRPSRPDPPAGGEGTARERFPHNVSAYLKLRSNLGEAKRNQICRVVRCNSKNKISNKLKNFVGGIRKVIFFKFAQLNPFRFICLIKFYLIVL